MAKLKIGGKNLDEQVCAHFDAVRRQHQRGHVANLSRSVISFDSPLTLKVIKWPAGGTGVVEGTTPADNPISFNLGPNDSWAVLAQSITPADMSHLVTDLNDHAVPELLLFRNSLGPSELSQLSGAPLLTSLSLGPDWASLDGLASATQLTGLLVTNNAAITGAELAHVAALTNLRELFFNASPQIDDSGMAHLQSLPDLRYIFLNQTTVGDSGVATLLGGVPNLLGLHLDRLLVTDTTVTNLLTRPALEQLDLMTTNVTDAGLQQLTSLTALSMLVIGANRPNALSDPTVLALTNALTGLLFFRAASTTLGNAALANMVNLVALEELDLSRTAIDDTGLNHLYGLSKLRILSAENTGVTQAGANSLEAQIPGLTVYY